MDPLTAFGLAASVVQFIDFSIGLVTEGNRIYNAADGVIPENKDTAQLTDDLSKLTSGLLESQEKWRAARGGVPLDEKEARLREICQRCTEISVELNKKLDTLKVAEGKHRKIRSIKQALVSVWKADELNATAVQLQKYRDEIQFHVILDIERSLKQNGISITRDLQNLIDIIKDGNGRVDDRLANIDHNLQLLTVAINHERSTSPLGRLPPPYAGHAFGSDLPNSTLHHAAINGDSTSIRKLLRGHEVDVNARGENACTALHFASTADVVEKLLLAPGVQLNSEDNEGRTALHYAVIKRKLDVVRALVKAGINKQHDDDEGKTAEFYAMDCPAAAWLLRYGPEIEAKAPDLLENTGLMQMAWLGDLEGTKFFISQRANVDARNQWQETALVEASRHGDNDVVKILLAAGADVQAAQQDGLTAITQAVRHGREDVVMTLVSNGANKRTTSKQGDGLLAEACLNGHFGVARWLVENGSDVNTVTSTKTTPLLLAAQHGDAGFTRFLLQRGAKLEAQDASASTALYQAAAYGNDTTLKVFLEYNANAEYREPRYKWTPLCIAASKGHHACVKLLLDHGVQVDGRGHHDHTALAEAAWSGHLEIVRLLVERKAKHDILDSAGHTALSSAVLRSHDEVVRVLATAGSDIDVQSQGSKKEQWSFTPLMGAVYKDNVSTVATLIELKANLDARNAWDQTALHIAATRGHAECARLLITNGCALNVQSSDGDTALMLAVAKIPEPAIDIVEMLVKAKANTNLRNRKMRTAWIWAVHAGEDEKLKHLLRPGSHEEETSSSGERSVSEIAAQLQKMYS